MMKRPGRIWLPEAPNIILARSRELELTLPTVLLEGRFTVELIDARTQLVKRKLEFRNLITNNGLDSIFSVQGYLNNRTQYFAMGTGSTAPANTDTGLVAEVTPASTNRSNSNGSTSDTTGYTSGSPDYVWGKRVRLFTETQANGNLTEIGLFDASTAGNMWARQLLKDGTGTPTTITKTNSDQLKVTYEVRAYPPMTDVVDVVSISAVNYDYTIRAVNVDQPTGAWRGMVDFSDTGTGIISGASVGAAFFAVTGESNTIPTRTGSSLPGFDNCSSVTDPGYSAGDYKRDYTIKWEPSASNYATGIGQILTMNNKYNGLTFMFGMYFHVTKIPKDNSKRLTTVLRQSIARYP